MKYGNMLYKFFVISDVHGEFDDMANALQEAGFDRHNSSHVLVTLGDMFDRGPKSRDIWAYLSDLKHNENRGGAHVISIKGNHDAMFQEYLEKGMNGEFVLFNILHNGLADTIESFARIERNTLSINELENIKENIKEYAYPGLLSWLQNLPLYFETRNVIFTHAGVDPECGENWKLTKPDYMLCDIQDSATLIPNLFKTVVFGHHHAFRVKSMCLDNKVETKSIGGDSVDVSYKSTGSRIRFQGYGNTDDNGPLVMFKRYAPGVKIAIDGCTNLKHKVNVLVFEDFFADENIEKEENEENKIDNIATEYVYTNNNTVKSNIEHAIPEPHWYYTNANETVGMEGWTNITGTHTFPF